jgi:hypothetical protein
MPNERWFDAEQIGEPVVPGYESHVLVADSDAAIDIGNDGRQQGRLAFQFSLALLILGDVTVDRQIALIVECPQASFDPAPSGELFFVGSRP